MRAPDFWKRRGLLSTALVPFGWIYTAAGRLRRSVAKPYCAPVPVICVGNLTAGGTGKTPMVIDLLQRLQARGVAAHAVSRGYGGSERGPVRVDPDIHTPEMVGDEPLLLSATAPVWVAKDRAAGVRAAVAAGAEAVVMDDGHQNPTVAKTLSLIVADAAAGFGNGRVIPAGPLREPVAEGLSRADAVILMGDGPGALPPETAIPVLHAALTPRYSGRDMNGERVFAFAGIGRPEKFFDTLRGMGAVVVDSEAFADHQRYDLRLVDRLLDRADRLDLTPVTTEKDMVKMPRSAVGKIWPVPIQLTYVNIDAVEKILDRALASSQ